VGRGGNHSLRPAGGGVLFCGGGGTETRFGGLECGGERIGIFDCVGARSGLSHWCTPTFVCGGGGRGGEGRKKNFYNLGGRFWADDPGQRGVGGKIFVCGITKNFVGSNTGGNPWGRVEEKIFDLWEGFEFEEGDCSSPALCALLGRIWGDGFPGGRQGGGGGGHFCLKVDCQQWERLEEAFFKRFGGGGGGKQV